MTREQIIKEFTDNIQAFQDLAFNIAGEQDADDLFQLCSLMLLEFPEDRLIRYYNPTQGLRPFFIRMLLNQYKSKTSKFHKEYRRQELQLQQKANDIILNEPQSEEEHEAGYFEQINKACNSIYDQADNKVVADLEKMIWDLYVETGSLRKTLAAIPEDYADLLDLKSVHIIVKKFQNTIKTYLSAVL
jgi:hypothetical protein